jgi:RimJ/RimL family protein N-acetyltransferase
MIQFDREKYDVETPIGRVVDGPPARRPARITLPGRLVTLAPLDRMAHGDALYEAIGGDAGDRLWRYLFDGPFADRQTFDGHLQRIAASEDPLFFAILDNASGNAVGYASYLRIEPSHCVIEVGNILYTPRLQQTALATEAMYLMARHVWKTWGTGATNGSAMPSTHPRAGPRCASVSASKEFSAST